jgi:hypothetical protein
MISCSPSISVNTAGSGMAAFLTLLRSSTDELRKERARSAVADCEHAASNTREVFAGKASVLWSRESTHTQWSNGRITSDSPPMCLTLEQTDTLAAHQQCCMCVFIRHHQHRHRYYHHLSPLPERQHHHHYCCRCQLSLRRSALLQQQAREHRLPRR